MNLYFWVFQWDVLIKFYWQHYVRKNKSSIVFFLSKKCLFYWNCLKINRIFWVIFNVIWPISYIIFILLPEFLSKIFSTSEILPFWFDFEILHEFVFFLKKIFENNYSFLNYINDILKTYCIAKNLLCV